MPAAPVAVATPASPPVIASPIPTDDAAGERRDIAWPLMLGAAMLALGGIGLWLARRRTPDEEEVGDPFEAVAPESAAAPPSTPAAPPAPSPLSVEFRPTRVGFNMLSATVEGELTLANEGAATVSDVRVRTGLLGAHGGHDADLAAFLAEPIGRSAVPPFTLQPGDRRTVRVVAAAPRAALRTMVAAGRPMFVPVLAVILRFAGDGEAARAFSVGVERVDSAKLAPFWLDVPDRAYAEVAARPHGPTMDRRG